MFITFINPAAQYLYPQTFHLVSMDNDEVKPYANTKSNAKVNFSTKKFTIKFDRPCPLNLVSVDKIIFLAEPQFKPYLTVTTPYYGDPKNSNNLDKSAMPFVIIVPADIDYPMERVSIENLYPKFKTWRESYGVKNKEWWIN